MLLEFRRTQAIELAAVNRPAVAGEAQISLPDQFSLFTVLWLNNRDNRQFELCSEFKVTLIMSGDSHNCARSIAYQNIITNPDGNLFAVNRIYCISAGKNSGFLFCQISTIKVAFPGRLLTVFFNFFFMVIGCNKIHRFKLWGEHHISSTKKRIRPGRKYPDVPVAIFYFKFNFGANAFTYPVLLQFFNRIRPVNFG